MKPLIAKMNLAFLAISLVMLAYGCSTSKTLLYQHNGQIFKEYTSGKDSTMLVNKGEYPQWIPGVKTHFAYIERQPGNPHMKLWVAEDDGKNPVALTKFEIGPAFSWSPDGKWIAVSHTKDGNYEIYKINVNNSTLIRLTNNFFTDHYPAWSPKGDKIAFISSRSGKEGIFVINADGTGENLVTPTTLKVLSNLNSKLSWSPDGKNIAFIGLWGTKYEIGSVNVQTGQVTQLTTQGGAHDPLWYDKYIFYFLHNDLYRYETSSSKAEYLGRFVPQTPHSALSANAAHVFFSYGENAPNPPHIYRVQHYTSETVDIGPGSWPDVW